MNNKKYAILALCCMGYNNISYANEELAMKGGLIDNRAENTAALPKVQNKKGNVSLYEATDMPLAETPNTMTVDPSKWCHLTDKQRESWKKRMG
jgi:hypothetical protein